MFATEWSAAYPNVPRGYTRAAWLSGPGVDDMALDLARRLAEATDPDDPLHDAWQAYATARCAVIEGARNGEPTDAQLDAEAQAWDGLVLDLGAAVRIPVPELDEVQALLSMRPRGRMSRWLHVWRERVSV